MTNHTRKKIQSVGTPNFRMRCHIEIGRTTLPVSGDKVTLTLSHANKVLLSHLSWFAGTRIRATKAPDIVRPFHFRIQKLFLPDLVNPSIRDRKSTRLNSSHMPKSRMPSSA